MAPPPLSATAARSATERGLNGILSASKIGFGAGLRMSSARTEILGNRPFCFKGTTLRVSSDSATACGHSWAKVCGSARFSRCRRFRLFAQNPCK